MTALHATAEPDQSPSLPAVTADVVTTWEPVQQPVVRLTVDTVDAFILASGLRVFARDPSGMTTDYRKRVNTLTRLLDNASSQARI